MANPDDSDFDDFRPIFRLGETLMNRIRDLEDNFTDINYKIDLIDNKIDAIQQIRNRRRTLEQQQRPT